MARSVVDLARGYHNATVQHIEKFEQMKEEINNLKGIEKRAGRDVYITYPNVVYKEDVIKIIDRYLDELKGDQE